MRVYFLSAQPCALTINGAYFGITNMFEKFANVSLKDNLCICFTPQNALPLSFFLTENIRFAPPEGCDVYLSKDAVSIYAHTFPSRDVALRVIAQKRREKLLVTVFHQGVLQATFQTAENVMIAYLPPSFSSCDIHFWEDLVILRSPNELHIYTSLGKCILQEKVQDFHIENDTLHTTLPLSPTLGLTQEAQWIYSEGTLQKTAHRLVQTASPQANQNIEEVMRTYAFFESVRIRADCTQFLCDDLLSHQDKLLDFLGNFLSVTLTDDPAVCGLVHKKAEHLFDVRYFRVLYENGKISDVSPL
jgi:hypothetical protein